MIPASTILEIRQWLNRHGAANCWTGTSGQACRWLHELLKDRNELLDKIDALRTELANERNESLR